MAIAEQARLDVLLQLKDQLSAGLAKAEAELAGFNTTAGKTTGATGTAARGVSNLAKATTGLGGAFTHAKKSIGGLITGNLGLLGLSAGILSLGGAFHEAVGELQGMALATEKLTGVTGESAAVASSQIALFKRYGLETEKAQVIAGFFEKTLGNLDNKQAKSAKSAALLALENKKATLALAGHSVKAVEAAIKLQKLTDAADISKAGLTALDSLDQQFGLHLKDAKGHIVDFQSALLQVADLYNNKAIPASDRAAVAAKLFGRSYIGLIPLLKLGSKGILEAEASAKELGLTLDKTNIGAVKRYIAAQRELSETIGGLKLQIGLALMPTLVELSNTISKFARENRTKIVDFFKGAIGFTRELGGAIHDFVLPAFSAIAGAWNAIPPDIRKLLIGGFVANKALKMTFGVDVIDTLRKTLFNAVLGIRAGVVNVQGGVINGPGGGTGIVPTGGLPPGTVVPMIGAVGVWTPEDEARHDALMQDLKAAGLFTSAAGPGGDPAAARGAAAMTAAGLHGSLAGALTPQTARSLGAGAAQTIVPPLVAKFNQLHADFMTEIGVLRTGNEQARAEAATKIAADITAGVGNVKTTKDIISALKAQIAAAKDPATKKVFEAALLAVQKKLPGREWIAAQEKHAREIAASTKTTKEKVRDLTAIQKHFTERGDTVAAGLIGGYINGLIPHIDALKNVVGVTPITINQLPPGAQHAYYPPIPPSKGAPHAGTGGTYVPKPGQPGYAPGKASGGPVARGLAYLVGERGPETFVPERSGTIIPTRQLRQAQEHPVRVSVNVSTSHRQNSYAAQIMGRYGPTPASAGAE